MSVDRKLKLFFYNTTIRFTSFKKCVWRGGGGYSPCGLLDDFKQFYIGIFGNLFKGTELQEFKNIKAKSKLALSVWSKRWEVRKEFQLLKVPDSVKWMLHVWITGCKSTQCSKSLS